MERKVPGFVIAALVIATAGTLHLLTTTDSPRSTSSAAIKATPNPLCNIDVNAGVNRSWLRSTWRGMDVPQAWRQFPGMVGGPPGTIFGVRADLQTPWMAAAEARLKRDGAGLDHLVLAAARAHSSNGKDPVRIIVLGGSMTIGITMGVDHCESDTEFECSWPARFQRKLDRLYGTGMFKVVNLAVAATCSACIVPSVGAMAAKAFGGAAADLVIMDYSVNDDRSDGIALMKRKVEKCRSKEAKCDPTPMIEVLVRMLLCFPGSPAVWMVQTRPMRYLEKPEYLAKVTAGKAFKDGSYLRIANHYALPYLDFRAFFASYDDLVWPHPKWVAHAQLSDLALQTMVAALDNSRARCLASTASSPEALQRQERCGAPPLTSKRAMGPFETLCSDPTMFYHTSTWGAVWAGSCWSHSHDDVPTRPDKLGWLFMSDRPGCKLPPFDRAKGRHNSEIGIGTRITFQLNVSKEFSIGYVRSYRDKSRNDLFGDARCFLESPRLVSVGCNKATSYRCNEEEAEVYRKCAAWCAAEDVQSRNAPGDCTRATCCKNLACDARLGSTLNLLGLWHTHVTKATLTDTERFVMPAAKHLIPRRGLVNLTCIAEAPKAKDKWGVIKFKIMSLTGC